MKNIQKRGSTYHLRRRVPARYATIEPRSVINVSLRTDSAQLAEANAATLWKDLLTTWEAKLGSAGDDAAAYHSSLVRLATTAGFEYLDADAVSRLSTGDIMRRVGMIPLVDGVPDQQWGDALLGGAEAPLITVTGALERYWSLAQDKVLTKSPDQLRRWRNARRKAIANFVGAVGDKALADITRNDALAFRDWWLERIKDEGRKASTANKDFIHLSQVLATVNKMLSLDLDLPIGGLVLSEDVRTLRPPFTNTWISSTLLQDGVLTGLNEEACVVLLTMINTGARPSEIANLDIDDIRLEDAVPHIRIGYGARQVKSHNARRRIPLVGCSLEAMRKLPDGFNRYRDNPSLSATQNKFLRGNGLMESEAHTVYGLRHSFEKRLREAGVDERLRATLMGHRYYRERYGEPDLLELRRAVLSGSIERAPLRDEPHPKHLVHDEVRH